MENPAPAASRNSVSDITNPLSCTASSGRQMFKSSQSDLESASQAQENQRICKQACDLLYRLRPYVCIAVAMLVFIGILVHKPFGSDNHVLGNDGANHAFALLMLCIILWIGNPVKPFVTAMLVPMVAVWLGKILIRHRKAAGKTIVEFLSTQEASAKILSFMINRIVTLVLGSFCLARALDKALAGSTSRAFSRNLLKYCYGRWGAIGGGPALSFILVLFPMYLSALVPHEAATMVAFNLVSPIIYALPAQSILARVLLLSLLLGGNIGGMISIISTPQNILLFSSELVNYQLSWFKWMRVSIPLSLVAALMAWMGIVLCWKVWEIKLDPELTDLLTLEDESKLHINHTDMEDGLGGTPLVSVPKNPANGNLHDDDILLLEEKKPNEVSYAEKCYIFAVALITIFLWTTSEWLKDILGGLGIVSFFPIVALFGMGVLKRNDLNHLPWDIVLLAMGATTLSEICRHSGAFELIGQSFEKHLGGFQGWTRLAVLCAIMAFSGAVKSRFVAALVYLPLAFLAIDAETATHQIFHRGRSPEAFAAGQKILAAFSCSAGMLLPISGLINVFLSDVRDQITHKRYLRNRDIIVAGAIGTVASLLCIITLGYAIIHYLY